ncbi:MAG: acyl-CoA dehydrogenase [Alphaproteobacteria bacterium]|nr:acyl-CoA dehydrogenase [Alphaproteobacteria bacterium]
MDLETRAHLKETIRRFVRERLVPLEKRVEEEDKVPDEIRAELKRLGLFGLTIPAEYGGLGVDMVTDVEIAFELGWTAPAFRSVMGTNIGIGSQGIVIDGTPEQKKKWLPKLASGEIVGSFALTEPDVGSDAASVKTRAVRKGDRYVVNGTKRFITNAPYANVFTLMARTDPDDPGAGGVSAFIVPADSKGIRLGKADAKMGQRGTKTCDVFFEDVEVPAENIIGGREGQGFKTAMKVLDRGRIHISGICVGTAERLIHESVGYAVNRRQFGKPIADFQLIQAMLADSRTEASAARALVLETAGRYDRGERTTMDAACCKYFASEMVGRAADRAVQIHGGAGYMAETPVEHFYRDVRLFRIYEGTSQIQQLVIAREMRRAFEEG